LIAKTLEKLIDENASQNELIEYIVLSIRKIQIQLDQFDNENLGEKKKRSSSDEVKRSRKQLFSSGLQGVLGVPGKKEKKKKFEEEKK
jgi:spore germination protein YaaH